MNTIINNVTTIVFDPINVTPVEIVTTLTSSSSTSRETGTSPTLPPNEKIVEQNEIIKEANKEMKIE